MLDPSLYYVLINKQTNKKKSVDSYETQVYCPFFFLYKNNMALLLLNKFVTGNVK